MALTVDTNIITADGGVLGAPQLSFADLEAQVLDYLDRPELSSTFPTWVLACQAKLNRILRTAGGEAQATLTMDSTGLGAPLPTDYQAWRTVQYGAGGRSWNLDYATPAAFAERVPHSYQGLPRLFTIEGTTLFTAPIGGAVLLTYYRGVPRYFSGLPNDWILLGHFDAYLYGVLCEAELYLKNDERAQMWEARLATVLNDIIGADRDARWGRAKIMNMEATP